MTTLKKFNTYLLTKQPLLWHSRVIQLTLIMLLLHVVFYVVGYFSVDLKKMLNDWRIEGWFFQTSVMLYWMLIGLIVLIVWGAFFFRNNAAKNFYPISRWYFHKLALSLFLPALLFLLIPFTFFNGVSNHAKKIISLEELQELNTVTQFVQPFLLKEEDNFDYPARVYPNIYKNIQYWENQSPENYVPTYLYKGYETNIFDILNKENAEPVDSLNGIYAFVTEQIELFEMAGNDTCRTYSTGFKHAFSKDYLIDFKLRHVKNYAPSNSINQNLLKVEFLEGKCQTAFPEKNHELSAYAIAAAMHNWIDRNPQAILDLLDQFKTQIDKFQIENNINPRKTYDYLIANDFNVFTGITGSYSSSEYDYHISDESADYFVDEDMTFYESPNKEKNRFYQFMNTEQLNTLVDNATAVHFSNYVYDWEMLQVFGYVALFITMLLIYFQWGNVLTFIISIPVAGVLIFVGALLYVVIKKPWDNDYNSTIQFDLLLYFVLAASVLGIAYFGVKKIWNTYVTDVALTISYFVWPLWITLITILLHGLLTQDIYNPCDNWPLDRIEPFSLREGLGANILLYSPYFMFWIWLFFIKRIIAKKEA